MKNTHWWHPLPLAWLVGMLAALAAPAQAFDVGGSVTLIPGCGANPSGSFTLSSGEPEIGQTLTFGVDNPLGTQAVGSLPLLLVSLEAKAVPCGISIPGTGMAGGGASGEYLIGAPLSVLLLGTPWSGPGTPAPVDLPIPDNVNFAGLHVFVQGVLVEPGGSGRLARAADVEIGAVPADLVLENGSIYTVDAQSTVSSAIAVRDGEIVFVGSDQDVSDHKGVATEVIDLDGRMAMPGVHDSHVHILEAFHDAFTCTLATGQSIPSYAGALSNCPPGPSGWVLGYGHSIFDMHGFLESGGNPLAIIDGAIPNSPAAIMEVTSHSVWVNSQALALLGIDASTPDPIGGVILRQPGSNDPNGILLEAAGEMAFDAALVPNPTLEQMNYDALLQGIDLANRNGITSLVDARCYWKRGYVEAWEQARDQDELTVRAIVGLWAYPYETDDAQQIADLISMYSNDPESRLRFSQVKLYADGEIEHTTAALLQPYVPDPFFFSGTLAGPLGINYFDQARLTSYVTQLEAAGFDCHIHAIGDRGVHEALDSVEAAAIALGGSTARHRLTHVSLVAPADVPRFAQLGVIADFQPVGPQAFNFFYGIYLAPIVIQSSAERVRTLYDAGARVVLSSDYDVGDISPFAGMERSLQLGGQSLPGIDAAIRAYTIEPAYLMRQEDRVGSIEVGKRADVIVLDRDITSIPTAQISQTQVLLTLLDGEEVWRDPGF